MNKTKIATLVGIFAVSLVLSGCSIQGIGVTKNQLDNKGGVYKSTDGAKTFEQKVKINETSSLGTATILSLALDPNNSERVFAGTKNGLYRSENGGEVWEKMTGTYRTSRGQDNEGKIETDLQSIRDIVINPKNSDVMYVPSKIKGTGVGKIMRTEDGGKHWDEIYTQSTEEGSIFSIAIDHQNPNVLYAGDSSGGVFKSEDEGNTWKPLHWHESGIKSIEVDNVNSQIVYFISSKSKGIRTENGGEGFIEINSKGLIYTLFPHPYVEGVIYLSDKEGLHFSTDKGELLNPIYALRAPEEINARGMAVSPNDDRVIYFISGKAVHKSVNAGESWKPIEFSVPRTIQAILIDHENTDILYIGTKAATKKKGPALFPF